jgi:hypothetical protein
MEVSPLSGEKLRVPFSVKVMRPRFHSVRPEPKHGSKAKYQGLQIRKRDELDADGLAGTKELAY